MENVTNKELENLYTEYVFETLNSKVVNVEGKKEFPLYITFPDYFEDKIYLDDEGIAINQHSEYNLVAFLNIVKGNFVEWLNTNYEGIYHAEKTQWSQNDDKGIWEAINIWCSLLAEEIKKGIN